MADGNEQKDVRVTLTIFCLCSPIAKNEEKSSSIPRAVGVDASRPNDRREIVSEVEGIP